MATKLLQSPITMATTAQLPCSEGHPLASPYAPKPEKIPVATARAILACAHRAAASPFELLASQSFRSNGHFLIIHQTIPTSILAAEVERTRWLRTRTATSSPLHASMTKLKVAIGSTYALLTHLLIVVKLLQAIHPALAL